MTGWLKRWNSSYWWPPCGLGNVSWKFALLLQDKFLFIFAIDSGLVDHGRFQAFSRQWTEVLLPAVTAWLIAGFGRFSSRSLRLCCVISYLTLWATVAKFDSLPIEHLVVPLVGWEVFVEERQERLSNIRQHTCVVGRIKPDNFPLPLSTILLLVDGILDALLKATVLEWCIIICFLLVQFRFIKGCGWRIEIIPVSCFYRNV